jgi:hypothetical protein
MCPSIDKLDRCLQLAIHNFERAELADSPALQARFRQIAGIYRDMALKLLNGAAASIPDAARKLSPRL